MSSRPRVALLVETSNAYARGLLRGIRAYIRTHGPWTIDLGEQSRGEAAPVWLRRWRGDGILARIETLAIARAIRASGRPVIDLSAARHLPAAPFVETDDAQIVRLALEHLTTRGFRQLAFCGDDRFAWSRQREAHFLAQTTAQGLPGHVYRPAIAKSAGRPWDAERRDLMRWLGGLPKPVGIMACYDIRGREVLDACRELSIAAPDAAAVIGVDNDELLCDLASPPLSSVVPDAEQTGYQAAELLALLMAGQPVAGPVHLVAPLGVVSRASTDVLAIDDAEISTAVRFIREHAARGIKVADVLRAVPLSRRVLETRFERLLGRSPHEEIVRVQLDRVKQLLVETDLPLAAIAVRAGFQHVEYLSVAFKRVAGQTPGEYRRVRAAGGSRQRAK